MSENSELTRDELPDRLSVDPNSPYYNADVLARDVGIRFKGVEKTNVEEYCVSEGWVRVTAGKAKDRYGNPLTITHVNGVTVAFGMPVATAHGTLTLFADGGFSYTPNAGFLGTDSFTYTVSDGIASAIATVLINVYDVH